MSCAIELEHYFLSRPKYLMYVISEEGMSTHLLQHQAGCCCRMQTTAAAAKHCRCIWEHRSRRQPLQIYSPSSVKTCREN